jgi:molybdate/tungstate transport system substrate-binding protein
MKYITHILSIVISIILLSSCNSSQKHTAEQKNLIIFHAGSLSVPFKAIADSFKKENPNITIILEAAGSVECARKITELNRECDILASADYLVIDKLLIPNFANWNLQFSGNEMVIAYTSKSKFVNKIDSISWPDILLNDDVYYGRSDPNSDPCGYRTLITLKLAEKYYKTTTDFYNKIATKDNRFIRPKEVDLLALLQSGAIDYLFIYKSVALQHDLKFISLNSAINLGDSKFKDFYSNVNVEIRGAKPNTSITVFGEPMIYSFTILKNAPNKEVAIQFAQFILDEKKGLVILRNLGMPIIQPSYSEVSFNIPDTALNF